MIVSLYSDASTANNLDITAGIVQAITQSVVFVLDPMKQGHVTALPLNAVPIVRETIKHQMKSSMLLLIPLLVQSSRIYRKRLKRPPLFTNNRSWTRCEFSEIFAF